MRCRNSSRIFHPLFLNVKFPTLSQPIQTSVLTTLTDRLAGTIEVARVLFCFAQVSQMGDRGEQSEEEMLATYPLSEGLTTTEAAERLKKYGPNCLPDKKKSKILLFCENLWQPMPIIIWIAAIVEFVILDYTDGFRFLFRHKGRVSQAPPPQMWHPPPPREFEGFPAPPKVGAFLAISRFFLRPMLVPPLNWGWGWKAQSGSKLVELILAVI